MGTGVPELLAKGYNVLVRRARRGITMCLAHRKQPLPLPACGAAILTIALGMVAGTVRATLADILHLTNGGFIDGEILETTDQGYRVRTVVGTVTIALDAVREVESAPSPFQEYERQQSQADQTAAAQFDLAEWCEQVGLNAERRRHLLRALELDPDHEPARSALGYVRVGELWVEARTVLERAAPRPADSGKADAEKLAAAIQTEWYRRLRAIRSNLLDSPLERLVAEGRAKVLEIADPLAIVPMSDVLSRGSVSAREVLVEALSRFSEDEATMNLAALALVDGDAQVRYRALLELTRRADPRVGAQFRRALGTNSEALLRRAAEGLGVLKFEPAVPDLIELLTVQRRKRVEVPVRRYLGGWIESYGGQRTIQIGSGTNVVYTPRIGVAIAGELLSPDTHYRVRNVTVFRTEVLEALKQITGQNFGFDEATWRRWYEEHKSS